MGAGKKRLPSLTNYGDIIIYVPMNNSLK